ncbi:hypothetical protein [Nocardia brasiliensis]|uniref:hypothetical protein n=1 Tax=Nocardia brasiliensis TaxID=37326 RepID=UPI0024590BA0|nr:hypothetical protein [Nocardia brasiliensis]
MGRTTFAAVGFCVIAALTGSAATTHAQAEPAEMHYTASAVGDSVVLSTDVGALRAVDGRFEVRDPADGLVVSMPLSYQNDNKVWPITARIDGRTATLTPGTDPATARPAPAELQDIAIDPQSTDFNTAVMNFATVAGLGVALGTLIGTTIGAALGCVAGGALVGAAAAGAPLGGGALGGQGRCFWPSPRPRRWGGGGGGLGGGPRPRCRRSACSRSPGSSVVAW